MLTLCPVHEPGDPACGETELCPPDATPATAHRHGWFVLDHNVDGDTVNVVWQCIGCKELGYTAHDIAPPALYGDPKES